MTYNTQYNNREIEYIDHNYSSDDSSLWGDLPDAPPYGEHMEGDMGHTGGLINPLPLAWQYRAGFSNTGESPKPQKRAPCQKKKTKKE